MKTIPVFLVALISFLFSSCNQRTDVWSEMEEYHRLMSETYHPFEEGNMEPVNNKIDDLVNAAENWADSEPPASMEKEGMDQKLVDLKDETGKLSALINENADTETISAQFEDLHDLFHQIQETYSGEVH